MTDADAGARFFEQCRDLRQAKAKRPPVSVVIPAYNQGRYLMQAIDSVLAEADGSVELIVVDDGSTDETPVVAANYGNRLRYVAQANQGLAGSRNTGMREANGDLIAFLDCDDAWLPGYLQVMLQLADREPDASVYYCGVEFIDAAGKALPQCGSARIVPRGQMYGALLRANHLIPSATLVRRQALLDVGGFDVAFRRLQDWELWIRLLRAGHVIAGTDRCLVRYRIHEQSLSADASGGQTAARMLVEKHFGGNDGRYSAWPADKRWAYGGYHRYCAIASSLVRMQDLEACAAHLRLAIAIDPWLATDLDVFYDLALGTQAPGYRGTAAGFSVRQSHSQLVQILNQLFDRKVGSPDLASLRGAILGTSYYALGLLAYNQGRAREGRKLLLKAVAYRPRLFREPRFVSTFLRAQLPPGVVRRLRALRHSSLRPNSAAVAGGSAGGA